MQDFILLNNRVQMPRIGYGVYQIPSLFTKKCVCEAIEAGYRSIDTAQCYGNEKAVGAAVRSCGILREEFFITTKLWGGTGFADTMDSIESSLKRLDLDYIDLLLIHEPTGNFLEIYRAMEKFYERGKLRAIGVANFLEDHFLKLIKNVDVKPQINQVETHVFRQQKQLRALLKEQGVQIESWSPLARGKNNFFKNEVLSRIAAKHQKTVAQVGLRFLYQQDIIVIPKSTHQERMIENKSITHFTLDEADMAQIEALNKEQSLFNWW